MTLTQRVEHILSGSMDARNSDKELQIQLMRYYGMRLTSEQELTFKKMPSLESVRRVRQKIQEQGRYPASKEVKRVRDAKAMAIEQNAPIAKPERIATLFDNEQYKGWR